MLIDINVLLTQAQERQVTAALGEEYVDWE